MRVVWYVIALLSLVSCGASHKHQVQDNRAGFERFVYQGMDAIFESDLPPGQFQNPILPGFFPDPSITRKGDDYYLAVSSFAYTPGVPILHSRDLVNWRIVGHALTRDSQFKAPNLGISRGIFAPTLRYHDGLFYLVTTAVDSGGNFIVTAHDPAGPWSDPIWLPEVGGIDPDLFFDQDGRVYLTHNDAPPGEPLYDGHRALWMWELNPQTFQPISGSRQLLVNGGVDISTKPVWIEGPHIYRIGDYYYLLSAEGGTSVNHSVVIFRTQSLEQPFVPYSGNPILTQRDMPADRPNPISAAGHADFVQTPDGQWYSVFLATRPYVDDHYNTGRETFLLPFEWRDGWPYFLPAGEEIPYRLSKPDLPAHPFRTDNTVPLNGNFRWQDDFDDIGLNLHWQGIALMDRDWLSLAEGQLKLTPRKALLDNSVQPAFIGRRQQHQSFTAQTTLNSVPEHNASAGLVVFQNRSAHYYLGVKAKGDQWVAFLEQVLDGKTQILATVELDQPPPVTLQVENQRDTLRFSVAQKQQVAVGGSLDATQLSTHSAGGFVGVMVGLHARVEP